MPYRNEWEPRGVLKRFTGHITADEILQSVVEIEADPRFDELRYVINDMLDVTGVDAHMSHADEIAAIDGAAARSNANIRVAIVATRADVLALSRRYAESDLNRYPTRIFSTMAEARAWTG